MKDGERGRGAGHDSIEVGEGELEGRALEAERVEEGEDRGEVVV